MSFQNLKILSALVKLHYPCKDCVVIIGDKFVYSKFTEGIDEDKAMGEFCE
jgi:hypothetical protein